ncbi:MAG TPA: ABC transporter ATP-binding protein [Cryomorphaceae bacterium]|nr:ABC transporter ATP-binding protein [Owenweeksia sp.]HAD96261.1 ABC transporter ATP-binding protein [Cryomorphaceae bacterium]HCQ15239.1 ABC transporter ATP-binding protein [Cryomorphaceae bacterium]
MEKVLKTQALTKRYGSLTAVNELELEVPKGSVFGILGPNGSGKTTTLGMVLGVTRPTSGNFEWFGGKPSFEVKQKVGALLETPNFYPYLSAIDNLKIIATIKEVKDPDIEGVLQTVNLAQRASSKFKTYSLGMKQRLAIAAALLSHPEVLVLDEPTNGLDPEGIAEIRSMILDIAKRGITVILASHLLYEIEKVCTHVVVLRKGHLIFQGKVDELTGHDGFIEIKAADMNKLETVLQSMAGIENIRKKDGLLVLALQQQISPEEINRSLAEKGIYVSHLHFRKNSLEKQFLNLIKTTENETA